MIEIGTFPWWAVLVVFVATLVLGIFVGAPIATEYYDLSLPGEVSVLFALMPFVYFYYLVPLCFVAAAGFWAIRPKAGFAVKSMYLMASTVVTWAIFYGIGVANYYAQDT